MVGALADWFAVTALFRHPLGLPIPHTAIIPKRKDQIGRSLGEFVQGNFLTREVLAERLAGVHVGQRIGGWLAEPAHAERAVGRRRRRREGRHRGPRRRRRRGRPRRHGRAPPAPGRRRPAARPGDRRQRRRAATTSACSTRSSRASARSSRRTATRCGRACTPSRRGGCRSRSTTASSARSSAACRRFLADVLADPDHEVRHSLEERVLDLANRLRTDPAMIAKAEELKEELLSHPEVQAWFGSLWGSVKKAVLDAADDPESDLRVRVTEGLRQFGVRLAGDPELQRKIDDWLERTRVLRRRQLQGRGRRPHRLDRRPVGQPRHLPAHRAAGRPRPPVHPHQRHRRRRRSPAC